MTERPISFDRIFPNRQHEKTMMMRIMVLEQICDDLIAVLEACMPLLSMLTDISEEARQAQETLAKAKEGRGPPMKM